MKTKPAAPRPTIMASEVARHSFCARALAYDHTYPETRNPSLLQQLNRQLTLPLLMGLLMAMILYGFVLSDVRLIMFASLGGMLLFWGLRLLWARWREPSRILIYHGIPAKRNHKLLIAKEFGLAGKPDYLLSIQDGFIPVLTKTSPSPERPHKAHILQIIAYCLLVAENSPRHPAYGIIRYGDGRTFEVDFDEDAIEYLSSTMDEIEANRTATHVIPNHDDRARCYACRHRRHCPESLF